VYVIQRVKAATKDGKPVGGVRTHFAAKVGPNGSVTDWTADRAAAVQVDDATALKVEDCYAAKLAAGQPVGTVTAEDVEPVPPPVTKPVKGPPPVVKTVPMFGPPKPDTTDAE